MNLETFKARARRKLELPHRSAQTDAARTTAQTSKIEATSEEAPAPAADSQSDRFAAALTQAREEELKQEPLRPDATTEAPVAAPQSIASVTDSPAQQTTNAISAEDSELNRLRSLLLGDSHKDQRDQLNTVYQRTQAGMNDLRQDIDARLDDLTKYVGQLEESILNSIDVRADESGQHEWARVAESTEARFQEHNERLAAFDAKLTNTLTNLRAEFEADRESDRAYLKKELAEASARTDALLDGVSSRLETSIAGIENRLSKQLQNQSAGLVSESETTVSNLRNQLGNLIDDRVRVFNDQQTSGLGELRDILLANTQELNAELKLQTEQQRDTLHSHREEIEKQLSKAVNELDQTKVSHEDLSQLLGRLADRLTRL